MLMICLFSNTTRLFFPGLFNDGKIMEDVHCSVIEHGMTSLSFQTVIQKNEAKLSSFVQFDNEL